VLLSCPCCCLCKKASECLSPCMGNANWVSVGKCVVMRRRCQEGMFHERHLWSPASSTLTELCLCQNVVPDDAHLFDLDGDWTTHCKNWSFDVFGCWSVQPPSIVISNATVLLLLPHVDSVMTETVRVVNCLFQSHMMIIWWSIVLSNIVNYVSTKLSCSLQHVPAAWHNHQASLYSKQQHVSIPGFFSIAHVLPV